MKSRIFSTLVFTIALMVTIAGCKSSTHIKSSFPKAKSARIFLPPGQAKKVYGHKSARAFAPGQQKKYYANTGKGYGYKKYKKKKK